MENVKLTPDQGLAAVLFFLDSVWKDCKNRFSDGGNELGSFLNQFKTDSATPKNWQETYKLTFGKSLSVDDLLNPEKVFTTMVELSSLFVYKFEYKILELVNLLYSIRYKPDEHKKEYELWQQAVERALK